jgi:hypothetical protein
MPAARASIGRAYRQSFPLFVVLFSNYAWRITGRLVSIAHPQLLLEVCHGKSFHPRLVERSDASWDIVSPAGPSSHGASTMLSEEGLVLACPFQSIMLCPT